MPKLLTNLKINEVSSVNRGAGEGVRIVLTKRDASDKAPTLESSIAALCEKAIGLGADKIQVGKASTAMSNVAENIEKKVGEADQPAKITEALSKCVTYLVDLVPTEKRDDFAAAAQALTVKGDSTMTPAEQAEMDRLKKSNDTLTSTVSKLALDVAIGKLSSDEQGLVSLKNAEGGFDLTKVETFLKMTPAERRAAVAEAADASTEDAKKRDKALQDAIARDPVVKQLAEDLAKATKQLTEVEKRDQKVVFEKRATDLGLPAGMGETIQKAYSGDAAAQAKLEKAIAALGNQQETAALFSEFGSSNVTKTGATAYQQIRAKAAELQKTAEGKGQTIQQCVNKVMTDPANADLVKADKEERLGSRRAA